MAKKKAPKKSKPAKKKAVKKKAKPAKKAAPKKATKKKGGAKKGKKAAPKKAAKKKAVKKKAAKKKAPKKKSPKKAVKKAAKKKSPKKAAKKAKAPKKAATKKAAKKAAPKKAKAAKKSPAKAAPQKKTHIPDIRRPTGMYGGVLLSDSPKAFPKVSPYSKLELKQLKDALISERDRLLRDFSRKEDLGLGGFQSRDEGVRFATESGEYSADMQAAETNLGVKALEEERLEQVVEALERLDTKQNYGLCLACGNKVGIERLIAKPHAHLCMECRRVYERKRG